MKRDFNVLLNTYGHPNVMQHRNTYWYLAPQYKVFSQIVLGEDKVSGVIPIRIPFFNNVSQFVKDGSYSYGDLTITANSFQDLVNKAVIFLHILNNPDLSYFYDKMVNSGKNYDLLALQTQYLIYSSQEHMTDYRPSSRIYYNPYIRPDQVSRAIVAGTVPINVKPDKYRLSINPRTY